MQKAFSLIELLVTLSIIAVLVGLLLPALAGARGAARTVACASNQRQIVVGLLHYSVDFGGLFPHKAGLAIDWHDVERIGQYVPGTILDPVERRDQRDDGIGLGVYVCPSDIATRPGRSYTMNNWAKSGVFDPGTEQLRMGEFFNAAAADATKLLLLTDVWSTNVSDVLLYANAKARLGMELGLNTPGMRFGKNRVPRNDPFGVFGRTEPREMPTNLAYTRHGGNDNRALAEGAVNIGYVDGHVALKRHDDLYRWEGDRPVSTLDTLWSPADEFYEQQAGDGP